MAEIIDNTDEVLLRLAMAQHRALESIGLLAEGYAKENIQKQIMSGATTPRTGNLWNSITHQTDDHDVYVGTNVDYAIYFEMGTGTESPYGVRKTPWKYEDANGMWHMTHGMRPRPFLKPAVTEHAKDFQKVIVNELKEA